MKPGISERWELFYRDQDGMLQPVVYFEVPESSLWDIAIDNGCVYVCDKTGGLYIYQAW